MNFLVLLKYIKTSVFVWQNKNLSLYGILKIDLCTQEFGHELEVHQGGNKLMFLISNHQLPSIVASERDMGLDSGMKTSRKQKQNKR